MTGSRRPGVPVFAVPGMMGSRHPEPKARDPGTVVHRDPSRVPSSSAPHLHAQSQRAAEERRARFGGPGGRAIGRDHQEGGIALSREVRESHREGTRQRGCAIDHQERERPAPQDHVRAPGRAGGVVRANHPQPLVHAEVRPVARRERARRVDVGHPLAAPERRLDDPPRDRRLATAPSARAHDLREPPARQPARRQHGIQLRDPRRHAGADRVRGGEMGSELQLQGGERHRGC